MASITGELEEHILIANGLYADAAIAEAKRILKQAKELGKNVFLFGNGGSMADAQHLAAEGLGIALNNPSSLTAIGNDYGFQYVFSKQLEWFAHAGDVVIAISTSGESPNVLRGVEKATALGLITIGLCGLGGSLAGKVDCAIRVPSRNTQRIQEIHMLIGHILCS